MSGFKLGLMDHEPMTLGDADICLICLRLGFKNDDESNKADYYIHVKCIEDTIKYSLDSLFDIRYNKGNKIAKKILDDYTYNIDLVNARRARLKL